VTLGEFRHQIRRFLAVRAKAARMAGVDPQQYQVLLLLKATEKERRPSIREVAEAMLLRHHSTVELIDRMERNRLLKRRRSEDDRRVVELEVLPRGEAVLKSLYISNREELSGLGRDLLKSLQAALQQ
jgi:DNA-binding MarR family transcriptional regulator